MIASCGEHYLKVMVVRAYPSASPMTLLWEQDCCAEVLPMQRAAFLSTLFAAVASTPLNVYDPPLVLITNRTDLGAVCLDGEAAPANSDGTVLACTFLFVSQARPLAITTVLVLVKIQPSMQSLKCLFWDGRAWKQRAAAV